METHTITTPKIPVASPLQEETRGNNNKITAVEELERGVYAALETYSNVHRGSGHNSMVTTHLYEQARNIVLEYLGLAKEKYTVIFSSPRKAEILKAQIEPKCYQMVSSQELGLSLGICALAVTKKDLPRGIPFQTGGGTAKLMSPNWVIWADAPDKFEAGTPAIINVIAFAKALLLTRQYGKDVFMDATTEKPSVADILYHDALEKYSGQELLDKLRQTLIGSEISVPTMDGARRFTNLDNSASTPTFSPIWNVFRQTWRQRGAMQQEIVYEVKNICAGVLSAPRTDYDVIFTSNATEAINLTAESLGHESDENTEPVILNTLLEHSSNDLPWRMVPHHALIRLSINAKGFIDLNALETLLRSYNQMNQYGKKRIKLVAVSGASNVLGVCNNIEEIGQIAHRYGARLLVDAAQLVAHRKIDMKKCGIDYLAFSAHKVYAPFGCGVLVVRKGLLNFTSAAFELIRSSGEENTGGIAALGKSLVLLQKIGMDLIQKEEQELTRHALRSLSQISGVTIYGIKDPESSEFMHKIGVIVFALKGIMPARVAKELAIRGGIGVRSGCHCAHILIKHILHVPPFFQGFQGVIQKLFPELKLPGLVRVSFGLENSAEDVDKFIQVLNKINKHKLYTSDNHGTPGHKENPALWKENVLKQMNDFMQAAALKVYANPH